MEFWKGLVESRVFSFVFAGQDAMPRFMDDFQNVFASMHPQELTYIDEKSARELIEEPIWNKKKNCSRFHSDAVDEIIKLAACSPFYIMIICSELVKYARQRKRLPIQLSDVNALVQKMICNESSISRKDFDNLISCGESRLDIIDKDDSLKVLKEIVRLNNNVKVILIGNGTLKEKIISYAQESGVLDNIIFLEKRTDVNELLQTMDVFLFPSLFEGLGLALIEAQAADLPCVISDTIPKAAILTEKVVIKSLNETPEEWAKAVLSCSENKERKDRELLLKQKKYDIQENAEMLVKYINEKY